MMKLSLKLWRLRCNGNAGKTRKNCITNLSERLVVQPLQKLLLLRKGIVKCKVAFTRYMEMEVLFHGAKRRKIIWRSSVGLLQKFGKRQLLSFGLPEMLMMWLTHVTGDPVTDSQGKPGQEAQLWGQRIQLCFRILSPGKKTCLH